MLNDTSETLFLVYSVHLKTQHDLFYIFVQRQNTWTENSVHCIFMFHIYIQAIVYSCCGTQ